MSARKPSMRAWWARLIIGGAVLGVLFAAAPTSAAEGWLELISKPRGASVHFENGPVATTPIQINEGQLAEAFAPGGRTLRVTVELLEHEPHQRSFEFAPGEMKTVTFALTPKAWCEVAPLAEKDIVVRRRVSTGWSSQVARVPPGKTEFVLTKGDFVPQTLFVDARADTRIVLNVGPWQKQTQRPSAFLDLTLAPRGATFVLDGKPATQGQMVGPGKRLLRMVAPTPAVDWSFEVAESTARVRFPGRMRPSPPLNAALAWLLTHQRKDGGWDAHATAGECGCESAGVPLGSPVGVTCLAILALAGGPPDAPADLRSARTEAMKRGAAWLAARSGPTAADRIGAHEKALVVWALAETLDDTPNDACAAALSKGVGALVAAQNPDLGWRYGVRDGDNDTSVTAFALMALQAARYAGQPVPPQVFEGGADWFDKMTDPEFGQMGYQQRGGGFPYESGELASRRTDAGNFSCTALGICGRRACVDVVPNLFSGFKPLALRTAKLLSSHPMRRKDAHVDFLYLWLGSRALRREDVAVKDWGALQPSWSGLQSIEGHSAGSFAPADFWSAKGFGGRTYATAVMALAMEEALRE